MNHDKNRAFTKIKSVEISFSHGVSVTMTTNDSSHEMWRVTSENGRASEYLAYNDALFIAKEMERKEIAKAAAANALKPAYCSLLHRPRNAFKLTECNQEGELKKHQGQSKPTCSLLTVKETQI